jgi:hypothetical protein
MVQQALNRHSQIVIPPETKFFFSFFGQPRTHQVRHIQRLNEDLQIELPTPARPLRSVAEGRAFYEEMARQYVCRLQKKDAVYFGEKTPEHTGRLPHIRQMFPESRIVVLYRDGRDVAVSLSRVPWMSSDVYVSFLVWLYYSRIIQDLRARGWPEVYFARYEDIVADPEKELGGILRFLELPEEPAVARGWGNREGIPTREYAWKERALQKITRDRVGIFRHELSPAEIETLERLGHRALTSFGYPLLTDARRPLSPLFLLRLSWLAFRFVWGLPWHLLTGEARSRLWRGLSRALPSTLRLLPAPP